MRREVVLDRSTDRILEGLAANYPGGRDSVVKDAIRAYAATEECLEEIVTTPEFRRMMRRSAKDIREGRVLPHNEAMAWLRSRKKTS